MSAANILKFKEKCYIKAGRKKRSSMATTQHTHMRKMQKWRMRKHCKKIVKKHFNFEVENSITSSSNTSSTQYLSLEVQ